MVNPGAALRTVTVPAVSPGDCPRHSVRSKTSPITCCQGPYDMMTSSWFSSWSSTRRASVKHATRNFRAIPILAVLWFVPLARADDLTPKFVDYMDASVKVDHFSGSVLVARDGEILFTKGYGLANREHNVPNTPETKFRLGSITKQFTAMAIMILVEQ